VLTPARGTLAGITRRTVIELAAEQGIPVREAMFGPETLRAAAEIFLTSTAGGVMPVTTLDGAPVGEGEPGRITTLLRQRYWKAHDEARWSVPIAYPELVTGGGTV
jgi:branched-chain amino acid aminotransferase